MMLADGNAAHAFALSCHDRNLRDNVAGLWRTWIASFIPERITSPPGPQDIPRAVSLHDCGVPTKAPALKAVLEGPYEPDQMPTRNTISR